MIDKSLELLKPFEAEGIDALFVVTPANQRYLEGFTGGDCFMLSTGKKNFLIADSRYLEMAQRECRNAEVVPHRAPNPPLHDVVASLAADNGLRRIGFEKDRLVWGLYDDIAKALSRAGAELVPTSSLVEGIRARKSPEEAKKIEAACAIADKALKDALPLVKAGISELDLKIELDYRLKTGGAEDAAFDTMVLFGARPSQPHASSRRDVPLAPGDFILIDYGACLDGYRSDTTRTFVFGRASGEQKAAYSAVLKSQEESLRMVAPGANGREINDMALGIIRGRGLPAFEYGIGHGVGLEIHEVPFMRQNTDVLLETGMVVTIEPGSYKPDWGGIRIEDTVLVTPDGHRALTRFPKELMEL
ncbi:MAG: Xaa-Pro peptidase family protein [Synergistaceae bacterium]|jgi:Xaa-Pro aminopeptidase|nr:Xaa-Pro peptidase family protein [Synergistaceae bacterium]